MTPIKRPDIERLKKVAEQCHSSNFPPNKVLQLCQYIQELEGEFKAIIPYLVRDCYGGFNQEQYDKWETLLSNIPKENK
jgi:hypothetical protein